VFVIPPPTRAQAGPGTRIRDSARDILDRRPVEANLIHVDALVSEEARGVTLAPGQRAPM